MMCPACSAFSPAALSIDVLPYLRGPTTNNFAPLVRVVRTVASSLSRSTSSSALNSRPNWNGFSMLAAYHTTTHDANSNHAKRHDARYYDRVVCTALQTSLRTNGEFHGGPCGVSRKRLGRITD